jgi:hypothetical protein
MRNILYSIVVFLIFVCSSCEEPQYQTLLLYNNSDKTVVLSLSRFLIEHECIKPSSNSEYKTLLRNNAIGAHSNIDLKYRLSDSFLSGKDTLFIQVFDRIDMDTMSCEQFALSYPIKKQWKLTKSEAELSNWVLTYP